MKPARQRLNEVAELQVVLERTADQCICVESPPLFSSDSSIQNRPESVFLHKRYVFESLTGPAERETLNVSPRTGRVPGQQAAARPNGASTQVSCPRLRYLPLPKAGCSQEPFYVSE